jgi:hypothetical protein
MTIGKIHDVVCQVCNAEIASVAKHIVPLADDNCNHEVLLSCLWKYDRHSIQSSRGKTDQPCTNDPIAETAECV